MRTPLALLRLYRAAGRLLPARFRDRVYRFLYHPDRRARDRVETVVPYGRGRLHVDTASFLEWMVFFHGEFEPGLSRLIEAAVPAGGACLDVGANVGLHTLRMAWAAGPSGRVVACEPHPDVRVRLCANLSLNGLENVAALPVALSREDGEATLHVPSPEDPNRGTSSLLPREDGVLSGALRIRTARPASVPEIAALERLDFVKIDTEGHEAIVVRELLPILERFHPTLVFEHHPGFWQRHGETLEALLPALRALGYAPAFLRLDGDRHALEPLPPEGPYPYGDVVCARSVGRRGED